MVCPGEGRLGEDLNATIESAVPISIVFHSNYGSILLSFRDMTTSWTTNDGQTMDVPTLASIA